MKSKYPKQHIVVSNKTLRALKKIKRERGFSNADQVINYLLQGPAIILPGRHPWGVVYNGNEKEGGAK